MDIKLVGSSDRSGRHETVLSELVTVMQKVAVELENNATEIQTKNEIALFNQKLDGVNGDIKGEVQRIIG